MKVTGQGTLKLPGSSGSPAEEKRIVALDFIRGVAVLGILLLNIVSFGLPSAAYLNPAWKGLPSLTDTWSWALSDLFAQFKFLSLFALLFGASLQMLLPRGGSWLQARLFWLLVLGLLHGVLLWEGDILFDYGLIGLLAWRIIDSAESSRALVKTAVLLYLTGCAMLLFFGIVADSTTLSGWQPTATEVMYESLWKTRGDWIAVENRWGLFLSAFMSLIVQYVWQLLGLMLLGAALLRNGWLMGTWSQQHYRRVVWWLIMLAWLIEIPAIVLQCYLEWDYRISAYFLQIPRDLSAPIQALGYAALCFGYWPYLARSKLTYAVRCVGRMALSNYLLQTLLATAFFYGAHQFNHYSRAELLLFVPLIWAINLLVSVCWLARYQQGPLEVLWRRLTTRSATRMDQ